MRPPNEAFDSRWKTRDQYGEWIFSGSGAAQAVTESPLNAWLLMMPPKQLDDIQSYTNRKLSAKGKEVLTRGQLVKFIGVLLLMTRYTFADRRELWATEPTSKYVPAARFGEITGMGRDRFDDIFSCLTFSYQPEVKPADMSHADYRWLLVDGFVDNINRHRVNCFHCSGTICCDESISRWYGNGGNWIDRGLPMYVAIDRKPENGGEIQNIVDGDTGIMLQLTIVKAAEHNARHNTLPHGTNVLMELTAPWHNSSVPRRVVADSFFSGVVTMESLAAVGLSLTGVVKTMTKKFPMNYLKNVVLPTRGSHHAVCCYNEDGSVKAVACVWVDRERRYFISKGGSLEPGDDIVRSRWRQLESDDEELQSAPPSLREGNAARVTTTTPQPKLVQEYFGSASLIDRHNRSRQANLGLERKVHTKDWATR